MRTASSRTGAITYESRINLRAESGLPFLAVEAMAARDIERHHDTVAFLQKLMIGQEYQQNTKLDCDAHPYGNTGCNLVDDSHVLMPEDDTRLSTCATLIHVKVTAGDRQPYQDMSRLEHDSQVRTFHRYNWS